MPVSQNQVRQREQHIQFGGLLPQSSVSRFSVPELPFDDRGAFLKKWTKEQKYGIIIDTQARREKDVNNQIR